MHSNHGFQGESAWYAMATSDHKEGEGRIVKRVGVREFRDRATGYLKEAEPIAVERHGRLIGFYIPVEPKEEPGHEARARAALERLERAVARAFEESGMTEDELADAFDLSKPYPPEEEQNSKRRS